MRTHTPALLLLAVLGVSSASVASDHRDAPRIDEDATLDLTDVFVFRSPTDPDRTVLAMSVNPFTAAGVTAFFSPHCLYEFAIDNDGDAVEDLVLQATFRGTGREQTLELRGPSRPRRPGPRMDRLGGAPALAGATGDVVAGGGMYAFAGLRDDPFFFDQQAFFVSSELREPGVDFYAGKNVSAIAVELPTAALAPPGRQLRVWARGARNVGRDYFQQDRIGLPTINVVLIPPSLRDEYNLRSPSGDQRLFGAALKQSLESLAIGDPGVRDALASGLLPDVLVYDPVKPSGFPNGRRLEDDVIDTVLGLLAAKGAAVPRDKREQPTDHVGENDVPFLPRFPYLAEPHAAR